jgi:glutamate/tyrosine decarboxylase-like PLP-dependent enzyme
MSLERAAEAWIAEHSAARHLVRTRDWLLALEPEAGEHLRIAALTHDVERRVPGGPLLDPSTQSWHDRDYLGAHADRSAALVAAWLDTCGAPAELRERVGELVRAHETGGWPEADLLQAADSLSFLEVNVDRVRAWVADGRCNLAKAREKLDWMRDRISLDGARQLAEPLHEQAVAALEALFPGQGQRKATLDLSDPEFEALLGGAMALAERELRAARDGPIFAEPPSAKRLQRLLDSERELPLDGEPLNALLETCAAVLAAGRRTAPAYLGYVHSPPSPVGVVADLVASAADQNVTSWRSAPAATEMERIVVRWLGQLTGFAEDAAGILVSGGSIANLTALLFALRARTQPGADRRSLVAYASEEGHFSLAKAAEVLGVRFRRVAVDGDRRLDIRALAEAIAADRGAGQYPFCVVGTAGTTATGAVDELAAIASVAAEKNLWFHVDGAYGALAAAVPAERHLFSGMERADSLSVDPHKWLYVPIDCGALLLRDAGAALRGFGSGGSEYVRVLAEQEGEKFAFWDHGLELSRRFRALKLWMTIRYYGSRRLAAAIAEDIAVARHMADLVRTSDDLDLLVEPSLSICCFRHTPRGLIASDLNRHNERLLQALQRAGKVYLSNVTVDGRFALRACVTNFRTTGRDVQTTVETVRELGGQLACGS